MNNDLLLGKRALVTGGTRGIGRAIVQRFLEAGASVVFFGTNSELGASVVAELESKKRAGASLAFVNVDVSSASAVEEGFKRASEALGGDVEILVNNAGITRDNLLMKMSEEDWDQVLAINLKAAFLTAKAAIRSMVRARRGKIINITSVVGLTGNAGQANYAASKAGLIGLTKSLAKEYASRGIQVNAIAPGFIETAMTDKLSDQVKEKILSEIPLARLGKAEEIAGVAVFVASPLADYVTGQTLAVDGGMVM